MTRGKKKRYPAYKLKYNRPNPLPKAYEWVYSENSNCVCGGKNVDIYITYDPSHNTYSAACEKCKQYYY